MYNKQVKTLLQVALLCLFVTACAQAPIEITSFKTKKREYFPESKYGRKASPHVTSSYSGLKARERNFVKIGKAYKVKNHWYYPKNYKHFQQVGKASWYGAAFQGRLTANGEVYDMNGLSAAHPTMPLPSYARVTNLHNGSSIIVRVNDRGPYVANRIIDLSKKAAQLLHYKDNGLAKVKVEYLGLAPLKIDDSRYLMASYRNKGGKNNTLLASNVNQDKHKFVKTSMLSKHNLPNMDPIAAFNDM